MSHENNTMFDSLYRRRRARILGKASTLIKSNAVFTRLAKARIESNASLARARVLGKICSTFTRVLIMFLQTVALSMNVPRVIVTVLLAPRALSFFGRCGLPCPGGFGLRCEEELVLVDLPLRF